MRLHVLNEGFCVCKIQDPGQADLSSPFLFLARTDEEISLVCPMSSTPTDTQAREDGWSAMRITGTLEFSMVGVLAPIASLLADEKISIFAASTYNTDYILVKTENLDAAVATLVAHGYSVCIIP